MVCGLAAYYNMLYVYLNHNNMENKFLLLRQLRFDSFKH